jgi:Alginate lyase
MMYGGIMHEAHMSSAFDPFTPGADHATRLSIDLIATDRERILRAARTYLAQPPVTITEARSPRSAGGPHDYCSEGDYWWPDPTNRNGPYVRRDGFTNPDNFTAHRQALIRLSLHVPALVSAWLITKEALFAEHAVRHLRAWFINRSTKMNPHLRYAQAIHGRVHGRGIGIVDTIHLVEVVRAASLLARAGIIPASQLVMLHRWFDDYLTWLRMDRYGLDERDEKNNHGTCWVLQVAELARFVGNTAVLDACRDRFKRVLVPVQIATDGSLPLELARTKPYAYSLFNLDLMATICQTLSTNEDDLWTFATHDGRGMSLAMAFMVPFIKDKSTWMRAPDVMYFTHWPVRHPSLLFAGLALNRPDYIDLWRRLDPDPAVDEIIRNYPIRQPVLWAL